MSRGRQKRVRGDAVWQATRAWLQRTNLWRERTDLRTGSERLRGCSGHRRHNPWGCRDGYQRLTEALAKKLLLMVKI
jgi:hypothetical protein